MRVLRVSEGRAIKGFTPQDIKRFGGCLMAGVEILNMSVCCRAGEGRAPFWVFDRNNKGSIRDNPISRLGAGRLVRIGSED
ncbi:hypothetical protein [Woodsholea maritima]|uniref:hypothetical protein n=1 Tax=Woodsholea maritima TaxID=240237 RepID=UPI0012E9C2FC|nr:hypothetical protein [Woodsholea maritima]